MIKIEAKDSRANEKRNSGERTKTKRKTAELIVDRGNFRISTIFFPLRQTN